MNKIISILLLALATSTFGQTKHPEEFGYKHIIIDFNQDKVDVLVKSKKNEENIPKPLFFFCQGSLPSPLIKYHADVVYSVFPFNEENIIRKYHLIIVSKPNIPLVADFNSLATNFNYVDSTGKFPKEYSNRNLLSYYVPRNIAILKHLLKQKWVSSSELVLAGHSEGSTIAAKMASNFKKVSHLIYAGGNPMGRIMSIIEESRAIESDTDSTKFGEQEIKYWESVVKNKNGMDDSQGDTDKATFEFSQPPIEYLNNLKIPVLVSYGTKDWSAPFNDYMRVKFIKEKKINFTFQSYVGTEHNFFPLKEDNKPNYDTFNWNKVADDWLKWLNENQK